MITHISFADFDDLQLAHESGQEVNLERFRAMISGKPDDESARVIVRAQDGNDYVVISTGSSYWFIALTNIVTGMGDFIAFEEYPTLKEALDAMSAIILVDNEHN